MMEGEAPRKRVHLEEPIKKETTIPMSTLSENWTSMNFFKFTEFMRTLCKQHGLESSTDAATEIEKSMK